MTADLGERWTDGTDHMDLASEVKALREQQEALMQTVQDFIEPLKPLLIKLDGLGDEISSKSPIEAVFLLTRLVKEIKS